MFCFHVVVRVVLPWITADSKCAMEPWPVRLVALCRKISKIFIF